MNAVDASIALSVGCAWCGARPGQWCDVRLPRYGPLHHAPRLRAAAAAVRRTGGAAVPCPVCNADGWYVRGLDRVVHLDGGSNRACWAQISNGADL